MKQVEMYGESPIRTPQLAKLADESLLFDRACCQYPLCGPSRASLMLSMYPIRSGITWNKAGLSGIVRRRGDAMQVATMPAWFRKHGYVTVGGGKLDGTDKRIFSYIGIECRYL